MRMRVEVIHETTLSATNTPGWKLWFQWCCFNHYDEGWTQYGYRFIWRRPNGHLQPARGQARIPSMAEIEGLIANARAEGWGDLDADAVAVAA